MTPTRVAWLRGRCPCCTLDLDLGVQDGAGPTAVGEGVRICGLCVEKGHDDPGIVAVLLAGLLEVAG